MTAIKRTPGDLAVLGGDPLFAAPVPVGQLYFPAWPRYETAMRELFARGWYTNHGPLARELEARLADFFQVKHVVTATNGTTALMMAAKALDLSGSVVMPGFTFVASAQAMTWSGLDVRFCDVDPKTHQVTPETVAAALDGPELDGPAPKARALDKPVSAVLGVNLWGGSCGPRALGDFARERGLRVLFDSAHGAGVRADGAPLGCFGDLEMFSFHATKVISATEGGCVTTNDDALAARLRNIRSSYGAGPPVEVPVTSNGRVSEAQAAIALMSLEDYPSRRANNEWLHCLYHDGLRSIPGLAVLAPANVEESNYQSVVVDVEAAELGISRDALLDVLHAENVIARRYFFPGVHRTVPYRELPGTAGLRLPVTEALCERLIQLPIGALVTGETVLRIVELLSDVQRWAGSLASPLAA